MDAFFRVHLEPLKGALSVLSIFVLGGVPGPPRVDVVVDLEAQRGRDLLMRKVRLQLRRAKRVVKKKGVYRLEQCSSFAPRLRTLTSLV